MRACATASSTAPRNRAKSASSAASSGSSRRCQSGRLRAEAGRHLVQVAVLVLGDGRDGEPGVVRLQHPVVERVEDLRPDLDGRAGEEVVRLRALGGGQIAERLLGAVIERLQVVLRRVAGQRRAGGEGRRRRRRSPAPSAAAAFLSRSVCTASSRMCWIPSRSSRSARRLFRILRTPTYSSRASVLTNRACSLGSGTIRSSRRSVRATFSCAADASTYLRIDRRRLCGLDGATQPLV